MPFRLRPYTILRCMPTLVVLAVIFQGFAGRDAYATPPPSQTPYPAQFKDPNLFSEAIAKAEKFGTAPRRLSGLTVPHHLVAVDLIAMAFRMGDFAGIDKVIVIFPDHFKRSSSPVATTRRTFFTSFGPIRVSKTDVIRLLKAKRLIRESDLFATDHGIGAILPFIKHHLPHAKLIPIAISIGSRQQDWDALTTHLKRIAGPTTLVVQSTDFSHFLPQHEALLRDQEVLNILTSDQPAAVARLRQPDHTDSRGAQYIQMRIQRDVFGAKPVVMFNTNSQNYTPHFVQRSTSYIVQFYEPATARRVGPELPGSKLYCFAGDTFFGRGMLRALSDRRESERIQREVRYLLNGCRLVVNLTGVLVTEQPVSLGGGILAMPASFTLEWLKALNVIAVNVANNHTMDLGIEPFKSMSKLLADANIEVIDHGSIVDLGALRITGLTDLDNRSGRTSGVIRSDEIAHLAESRAKPPVFAMVNWGPEFEATPTPRQLDLVDALHGAAVSLIVGVRPHVAAKALSHWGGGRGLHVYSLGNFLFDQSSKVSSGSILEVRVFDQGTYFARLIPHSNFYDGAPEGDTNRSNASEQGADGNTRSR